MPNRDNKTYFPLSFAQYFQEISIVDGNINPCYNQKQPKKIYNFKNADWRKNINYKNHFLRQNKDQSMTTGRN